MEKYKPVLNDRVIIASFAVDRNSVLKLNYLTAFLQEAAWKHAQHLDLGYEYLQQNNFAWMLSRIKIHVEELPKWRDEIVIETWPKGVDGLSYTRDFIVSNEGKQIIKATSYWLLVDLITKRPKIPELHTEILTVNQNRHAVNEKLTKIAKQQSVEIEKVTARNGDIDLNNHVNSNKYVEWIVNTIPDYSKRNRSPFTFQINYLQEVSIDETISLYAIENNFTIHCEGIHALTGKTCFQSFLQWR
ncbi:MAG: hypothetical protein HC906_11785 [Bacteroidales bacterium]|nr:hypothetical protein [Bacteroidales bacterium]